MDLKRKLSTTFSTIQLGYISEEQLSSSHLDNTKLNKPTVNTLANLISKEELKEENYIDHHHSQAFVKCEYTFSYRYRIFNLIRFKTKDSQESQVFHLMTENTLNKS